MKQEYCILYRECPAYDSNTCSNQEFRARCKRLEDVFALDPKPQKEEQQDEKQNK